MEIKRRPFQGVCNIIRFNRHFYIIAVVAFVALFLLKDFLPQVFHNWVTAGILIAALAIFISLLISFYIYDLSGLYRLKWLKNVNGKRVLNINAGFDETSAIIQHQFPDAELSVCDFYNPDKHTEISVKRARKAYPPYPDTISVKTDRLPFAENTFDISLAVLSAHEIRNKEERILFFKELKRVTKGQILVTEHLRDFNNFLAYTIGFFHFYSRKSWLKTFENAGLIVRQEMKSTLFITTFILENNGNTL